MKSSRPMPPDRTKKSSSLSHSRSASSDSSSSSSEPSPIAKATAQQPRLNTSAASPSLNPDSHVSPNRPPLQRQSASRTTSQETESRRPSVVRIADRTSEQQRSGSRPSQSSDETSSDEVDPDLTPQGRSPNPPGLPTGLENYSLDALKREMNAKLAMTSQKIKMTNPVSRSSAAQGLAGRRVSPIKEEPLHAMSPTLEGAFASPLTTGQRTTTSTESTESNGSSRTIRGSAAVTPAIALRTPSYPFPYVPGTPRTWSSSFHRPFTTLSPTVSSQHINETPSSEPYSSEASTPAAGQGSFAPADSRGKGINDDPQYPAPNLYDLVLNLSAEPGLDSWWTTLSQTLYELYGVERMSLAIPADAGELENVPWGQKASYNFTGPPKLSESSPSSPGRAYDSRQGSRVSAQPSDSAMSKFAQGQSPHSSARPRLSNRHSYAGHERDLVEPPAPPQRPRAPSRTKSYAPQVRFADDDAATASGLGFSENLVDMPRKVSSFSDPDFSIADSSSTGPYMEVLPLLRALNYESHALIDNTGVNKILARGKVVALTRDYSSETVEEPGPPPAPPRTPGIDPPLRKLQPHLELSEKPKAQPPSRDTRTRDYFERPKTTIPYEEYEQFPASPWAQSPAPSPAMQADPTENPFFAGSNVDEETFNPAGSTPEVDYSKFRQVEAIGIDQASTIIHIPLVHPVLSRMLPPYNRESSRSRNKTPLQTPADQPPSPRKAPIAILSLLATIVPYPQSLLQSLKLLAPHLATSFSNASQYTSIQMQTSLMSRSSKQGRGNMGNSDSSSLERLMGVEIDSSMSGSLTSPSDYSERSRRSPGGSVAGTPGSESGHVVNFPGRPSLGTPGVQAEGVDSYFDAKRRTPISVKANIAMASQGRDSPMYGRMDSEDLPHGREIARSAKKDERLSFRGPSSPKRRSQLIEGTDKKQQHGFLHSYGADFTSSFQSLPAPTASSSARGSNAPPFVRTETEEGNQQMPPPSERLLRTIIDSLPVQIFTCAPNTGALTWVNTKYIVYRGLDSQTILQDPWQGVHPEDRDVYRDSFYKCLANGQQFSHKVRLKRFDNNWRWFYTRASPLRDKRQKIVHWAGTNMDIHEQHLAEVNASKQQETAASEAKYRALANSSPQIVFAVNHLRGVTFCNSQWLIYSGQTEEQARGIGFMDFVHPGDIAKCKLPTFNDDGDLVTDAPTSTPPDVRRMDSSKSVGDDSSEGGRTVTSPGATSPAPLAVSQAKLSRLASTGILKVSKDPDGRPSYSTEVRLRSKEGEYRWHLVRVLQADPVVAESEEEATWYGTCTDINDHKVLEQTLKDTMDAKSRFLSNMSHEIRTPLNGITGMVNFLIDSNLSAEQMEHVNIIRSSTEGLRDLINDILDLSKVEAGMINLQAEWMHVRTLIEEINDLTSSLSIDKGLELNYMIEDDVPSIVKGDRFRIRQVLLNVVGNAIKFTQIGEVFVLCSVIKEIKPVEGEEIEPLTEDETMLRFDIMDTGAGFSEEEARFLFKRFSQIDSSSTKQHGGTGLGLAISMQLVELHGGKMSATSTPGKGSTFTFTIRFSLPTETDHPALPAVEEPGIRSRISTPAVLPARPIAAREPSDLRSPPIATLKRQGTESPADSIRTHQSGVSSGGSEPSLTTARTSASSGISSTSSLQADAISSSVMVLELPTKGRGIGDDASSLTPSSVDSEETVRSSTPLKVKTPLTTQPSMFSILLVCPMLHAREATVRHIQVTIPRSSPHHITAKATLDECSAMFNENEPVIFTHVVLVLRSVAEITSFLVKVFTSPAHSRTNVVIITDLAQKREIFAQPAAKTLNYERLQTQVRRLWFVFKPIKPSKFSSVFDPRREGELALDRSQDNAQAVQVSQKQVFEDLKNRLGGRGLKVLLVEDNKTNQMVLQKFLKKVDISCDCVMDGKECTDRIINTPSTTTDPTTQPPAPYNIILCDLHMPNKDGYQTCKEIRRWERKSRRTKALPIVALSANVLGDVYEKCEEAGFNGYVTKPVDFKELGEVLTYFLDGDGSLSLQNRGGDLGPGSVGVGKFLMKQK